VAVIAFIAGVTLWGGVACLMLAGGGDDGKGVRPSVSTPRATPTAAAGTSTPLPDRRTCSEIRGTEYRSAAERQWYLDNCTGPALAPTPVPTPTVRR